MLIFSNKKGDIIIDIPFFMYARHEHYLTGESPE